MQISTNTLFERAIVRMGDLNGKAAQLNADISTTKDLNRSSDNSVAFHRVTLVKRAVSDEAQFADNVDLAAALLDQSDSAMEAMETQMQRASELAIRASNDTLSETDRKTIAIELRGILDTMMAIGNATDARGQPLFGGADGATPYAKAADGAITFQGSGQPSAIPISATGSIVASDSGARVFGGIATTEGGKDVFAIVQSLATALETGDPAKLKAQTDQSLTDIKAANEHLGNARSSVGARGARLTIEADQYKKLATSREEERSGLEDTDIPAAITRLQQTMLALQATQASYTKLSQMSLFDYLR